MAANRRNQQAPVRLGPVLKVMLISSVICGAAIGYVWHKNENDRLGRQIVESEKHLKQLQEDNNRLSAQIAILNSPVMIDQRVRELNLGLIPAQPGQKVTLVEVPVAPPQQRSGTRQFALRPADAVTQ